MMINRCISTNSIIDYKSNTRYFLYSWSIDYIGIRWYDGVIIGLTISTIDFAPLNVSLIWETFELLILSNFVPVNVSAGWEFFISNACS